MPTGTTPQMNLTITRDQVMEKLSNHGEEDIQDFLNKYGDKPAYNPDQVLYWLGY